MSNYCLHICYLIFSSLLKMKVKMNGEEIDTIKICGILSFLFDKTIKVCSYSISNKKPLIEFEIVLKNL